jgi:hypothetical protein
MRGRVRPEMNCMPHQIVGLLKPSKYFHLVFCCFCIEDPALKVMCFDDGIGVEKERREGLTLCKKELRYGRLPEAGEFCKQTNSVALEGGTKSLFKLMVGLPRCIHQHYEVSQVCVVIHLGLDPRHAQTCKLFHVKMLCYGRKELVGGQDS